MQELLNRNQKHFLYKDEYGEEFVLLKYGEAFNNSDTTLKIHTWSRNYRNKLAKMGVIDHESTTDDPLFILTVQIADWGRIIGQEKQRNRLRQTSKVFGKAERALCHKIIRFNGLKKGIWND